MFEQFFMGKVLTFPEIQRTKSRRHGSLAPQAALAVTPGRASISTECDSDSHLENMKE